MTLHALVIDGRSRDSVLAVTFYLISGFCTGLGFTGILRDAQIYQEVSLNFVRCLQKACGHSISVPMGAGNVRAGNIRLHSSLCHRRPHDQHLACCRHHLRCRAGAHHAQRGTFPISVISVPKKASYCFLFWGIFLYERP
jgi:hypothetical protein